MAPTLAELKTRLVHDYRARDLELARAVVRRANPEDVRPDALLDTDPFVLWVAALFNFARAEAIVRERAIYSGPARSGA